jgi:hypothetical protein
MLALILFLSLAGAQASTASTETAAVETSDAAAAQEPSRERLICRSRPMLGSRIARQRVCKTEEDWKIYQNDLEQSRRDINDRGMRGCTSTSCE